MNVVLVYMWFCMVTMCKMLGIRYLDHVSKLLKIENVSCDH